MLKKLSTKQIFLIAAVAVILVVMVVAGVSKGSFANVACVDCHATGLTPCSTCLGTAEIHNADGSVVACDACGASGHQINVCDYCGGDPV